MILLLIRHAQSAGNAEGRLQGQTETPLTALGRRQAEALARRRDPREWSLRAIYASDLGRAVETAEIVMDAPDCAFEPDTDYQVSGRHAEIVIQGKGLSLGDGRPGANPAR